MEGFDPTSAGDNSGYINDSLISKKRVAQLNESFRRRYATYIKMGASIIFGILAYMAIISFPLPSILADVLTILDVLIVVYLLYSYYSEINSRMTTNYDELAVPDQIDPSNSMLKAIGRETPGPSSSLLGLGDEGCVGEQCCKAGTAASPGTAATPGTHWDKDQGKCVIDSFATIGEQYVDRRNVADLMSNVDSASDAIRPYDQKEDKMAKI